MTANMPAIRRGLAVDTLLFGLGVGGCVYAVQYGSWQLLTISVVLLWLVGYDWRQIRRALKAPVVVTTPVGGGDRRCLRAAAVTRPGGVTSSDESHRPALTPSLRRWPPDVSAGDGSCSEPRYPIPSAPSRTVTYLPTKAQR